ncbi:MULTISPECIES: putative alpha/beta hydrolase [Streptomyces]|uniref:putative alpha/beta hydrolase n=1 Tax=Streptomyces TaxID=1883 RepID=UPI0022491198|nr:hypothetical protein [Streptomyces sp. JHD 1]MCX2968564.1 hypothetical protein [Streptomyces sp. JHD 1]
MADFTITKAALIEAAGCDPYELRENFELDTDPEMVGELSGIFKNGAEEAQETGSVAEYASDLEERAGNRGGNAIYDEGAAHLEQTYAELGEGALREVSKTLGEIEDEMAAVRTYLGDSIDGEMGLEYWREWYASQANQEVDALLEGLADLPGDQLYRVSWEGREWTAEASTFPRAEVRAAVEEEYTERAGEYAAGVHDRMTQALDDYYAFLDNREARLAAEGYDVGDTPVEVWYSDGRAEYEATQLEVELGRENPDPDAVERYTTSLDTILDRIGQDGRPLDVDALTEAEREYLKHYFDTLSPDALAAMGQLEGGAYASAQEALAGGVMASWPDRPSSVRPFLGDDVLEVETTLDDFLEDVEGFNAFGALMGHASVVPPDEFADLLVETATSNQRLYEGFTMGGDFGTDLDGAGTLLTLASRNADATTEIMGDGERARLVLGLDWTDEGTGASNVVRAATQPGADGPTQAQADAARNVVATVAQDPDLYADKHGLALESAVADVGVWYMDSLTSTGTDDGGRIDVFGNEMTGFTLSAEERQQLFAYIARTEEEAQETFTGGVDAFTHQLAYEAFSNDHMREAGINNMLTHLGTLHGALEHEMLAHQLQEVGDADKAAAQVDRIWRAGSAAAFAALGKASGPIGDASGWAGIANGLVTGMVPLPVKDADDIYDASQYDQIIDQGRAGRHIIVEAAIAAGDEQATAAAREYGLPGLDGGVPVDYTDDDFLTRLAAAETGWDAQLFYGTRNDLVLVDEFAPENRDDDSSADS